ncbi:hypothetical protein SDJN02_19895, partial [Cucurbita argyrosperma subsp. argyrosperma]
MTVRGGGSPVLKNWNRTTKIQSRPENDEAIERGRRRQTMGDDREMTTKTSVRFEPYNTDPLPLLRQLLHSGDKVLD